MTADLQNKRREKYFGSGNHNPNQLAGVSESGTKTGAVGSGFLNGSFSGSDIRVIVNLPVNPTALEIETKKLNSLLQELDRRESNAIAIYEKAKDTPRTPFSSIEGAAANLLSIREQKEWLTNRQTDLYDLYLNNAPSTLTKTLATIQTISWSIFREKSPVRFLGSVYPRAYVRGPRTIAGSMIFTMFDTHAFQDILNWGLSPYSTGHVESDHDYYHDTTMLIDQLPPLDLTLMFANEYSSVSYMNLYGVEFQSEGGTFSVEDLFSESVVQYVARDIDPIRNDITRVTDAQTKVLTGKVAPKTASQLRREEIADHNLSTIKRRNPYI